MTAPEAPVCPWLCQLCDYPYLTADGALACAEDDWAEMEDRMAGVEPRERT